MSKVPAGWEETTLEKFINIKHGFAFKSEFFSDDSEFILLTPGNFYEQGGFREQHNKTKYYIGDIPAGYILNKGDLLLAMTEQSEGLLGSAILVPENNKFLHNQRLGLVNISDAERVDYSFLYFIYNSPAVRKQIAEQSSGTKVKHTSPDRLRHVLVLLPPLPEQTKIAQILSIWDKAIATTEKLIGNSQQQKKLLVQQLLSGKKRLPGFFCEWCNYQFSELMEMKIGGTPSRNNPDYWDEEKETSNRWLSIANLKGREVNDTSEYLSDLGVAKSNVKLIPSGTIVMSFKLTIGRRAILKRDCYTNEAICAFIIQRKDLLMNEFLYHALEVVNFDLEVDQAVKGKTLNKEKLKRLRLSLPHLEEQQKIAAVLTAADNEIELLQKKLAFLKQEKAALMQQLLTGKRRLEINTTEECMDA